MKYTTPDYATVIYSRRYTTVKCSILKHSALQHSIANYYTINRKYSTEEYYTVRQTDIHTYIQTDRQTACHRSQQKPLPIILGLTITQCRILGSIIEY